MGKPRTVMIVDDDPIYTFGATRTMEIANFCDRYVIYKNGQDALEYLIEAIQKDEDLPDAIFLDLNMPQMDGWEFLNELNKYKHKQSINIYIVSSSINPEDLDRARRYDFVNSYIQKPITLEKLDELDKDID